jgi:hypothetical protein
MTAGMVPISNACPAPDSVPHAAGDRVPCARRFNSDLLTCYDEAFDEYGVRGCSREALREDYRRPVIQHLQTPMFQSEAGVPPPVWWNNLERIMLPFEDLDCEALL